MLKVTINGEGCKILKLELKEQEWAIIANIKMIFGRCNAFVTKLLQVAIQYMIYSERTEGHQS